MKQGENPMPYKVQFVGLVCFFRERGGRHALLPDGRKPVDGVDPHYASIVVDSKAVLGSEGWANVSDVAPGRFPLEECNVVIEGAAVDGPFNAAEHKLPQLREINPKFEINLSTARTVARLRIRQGVLQSRVLPGGTALISQLTVEHEGPITIMVNPDDGAPPRTIRLAPGTEIAIINMARGDIYRKRRPRRTPHHGDPDNHFRIYEQLNPGGPELSNPVTVPAALESDSHHVLFNRRGAISLYTNCSNTGCC